VYENEQFLAAGVHESGYFTRRQTEIAILPAPSPSHSFSVPRFPLMQIWGGLMKILEIACDNLPKRSGSAGTLDKIWEIEKNNVKIAWHILQKQKSSGNLYHPV
jgi:hypothetical protein